MKNAKKYLEQINRFNRIFGKRELQLPYDRHFVLSKLESDLSPENLTCDGELSRAEVQAKLKFYRAVEKELNSKECRF